MSTESIMQKNFIDNALMDKILTKKTFQSVINLVYSNVEKQPSEKFKLVLTKAGNKIAFITSKTY